MDAAVLATFAGPTLAAAAGFFLTRLGAALDRKPAPIVGGKEGRDGSELQQVEIIESAVTPERIAQMREAAGILSVYAAHPEIANGRDPRLVEAILSAYDVLGAVYGVKFEINKGETGRLKVSQELGEVSKPVVGLRSRGVAKSANIDVRQSAVRVGEDGSLVGIEIEGVIE